MQLAASAYACPTPAHPATMAAGSSDQSPCGGMDEQLPNLCEQHCFGAPQSVDTQPTASIAAPVLPLLAVIEPREEHVGRTLDGPDVLRIRIVNPPPLIRFGVLRI